ncbi:glycosyltransferase family 4 protein [Actinotalea sp.]|uniref:glycosyltransferase family 4 protein n=1 Tax=Actinotalea sp. TaxID=1872145 RepID=UPI0035645F4A
MRIVHVSDCYPPRMGGIETQVRDLAAAQAAAGHEVHVLTATPLESGVDPGGEQFGHPAVTVHRMGVRLPFDVPVNPAAPAAMRELFDRARPDVVHVHAGVVSPFAFDGARVALDRGVPLAITWHCMLDGVVPALRLGVRRTRWAEAPVALSAVSTAAAERVREVFGGRVDLVPNGADLARWAPSEPVAPVPPVRAVATMRLAPRKRGPALIAVVEDAVAQVGHEALRVDVVGDGPMRAPMQRSVDRRRLGDVVTLHGRLERDRLPELYRRAHVFLAPAALEAFGIAALEARAAGLVVVARKGTGIEEFVSHDVDGLLVDDDAGMARALARLVHEPGLLGALGSRARGVPPVFGWSHTQRAADALYSRARALRGLTA